MHFSCTLVKDLLSELKEFFFLFVCYLVFILPFEIVVFYAQFTQIKAGIILGVIAQYFTAVIGYNVMQFFINFRYGHTKNIKNNKES